MVSDKIKSHNVNNLMLIRNKDFYFMNDNDKKIIFKVPNFDDYLADTNLSIFLSMLEIDKTQFKAMNIRNNYDLILAMLNNNMYLDDILSTLHKYIPDLKIEAGGLFVTGEYIIPEELDFIILVWKIALGIENLDILNNKKESNTELDEFEKRIQAQEEKIKKIKNKVESDNLQLDKVLITIMKEFNLTIDQILKMNLFTIFWYYVYALKISNYDIEVVAFGNGLLKKHKHFAE